MKLKSQIFFVGVLSLVFVSIEPCCLQANSNQKKILMSQEEYQQAVRNQNQFHFFLRTGRSFQKTGDLSNALDYYLKAFGMAKGSSLEGVTRGALAEVYEEMGSYEEALMHVNWALARLSVAEPLYLTDSKTKSRLLEKIKEQKAWEAKQDPVVVGVKNAFPKSNPKEQRKFLESLGGPGVMDIFKDAMVAEHGGNFTQALKIYESLLSRKTDIEKEMGVTGWVMLYPAIQRNAEMAGAQGQEKQALLWIKGNLLPEDSAYHSSLSRLLPEVVAHLNERIKKYQL